MQLGSREEPGRGRVQTVVWADGSESDLDAVVVGAVAVVLCAVGVVGASAFHGLLRTFAIGLAVVAGLYAALMLVPVFLVLVGAYLVGGIRESRHAAIQRVNWLIVAVLGAVLIGGALGTDAYGVGSTGLLTGPVLVAGAVIAVQTLPSVSLRARHRVLGLAIVAAVSALLVGLTVFL